MSHQLVERLIPQVVFHLFPGVGGLRGEKPVKHVKPRCRWRQKKTKRRQKGEEKREKERRWVPEVPPAGSCSWFSSWLPLWPNPCTWRCPGWLRTSTDTCGSSPSSSCSSSCSCRRRPCWSPRWSGWWRWWCCSRCPTSAAAWCAGPAAAGSVAAGCSAAVGSAAAGSAAAGSGRRCCRLRTEGRRKPCLMSLIKQFTLTQTSKSENFRKCQSLISMVMEKKYFFNFYIFFQWLSDLK